MSCQYNDTADIKYNLKYIVIYYRMMILNVMQTWVSDNDIAKHIGKPEYTRLKYHLYTQILKTAYAY